jgi:hypothetical protein
VSEVKALHPNEIMDRDHVHVPRLSEQERIDEWIETRRALRWI